MIRGFLIAIGIAAVAVSAQAQEAGPAVRINGSTSVANSIVLPHQAEIEKAAAMKMAVTSNSSGAGVADLLGGKADIAMISSGLDEIVAKLANVMQAYKVDKSQLRTFDVGEARVEFIVNSQNAVRKLTAEQLKAIYLGKLTNWQDVGGQQAKISAFSESRGGAMRTMLEHEWLGGQKIADAIAESETAPQVASMVARHPNGIGFVSSTTPKGLLTGTAPIETDSQLVQHLTLVTIGDPTPEAARLIDVIKHMQ